MPLNILTDNIGDLTRTNTDTSMHLTVNTSDPTTAVVIERRLREAIRNLGDTAHINLTIQKSSTTNINNDDF